MKQRNFRELQVSSTQLALIFLVALTVTIVIFLLGVAVGRKYPASKQELASGGQSSPAPSTHVGLSSPPSFPGEKPGEKIAQEKITPLPEEEKVEPTSQIAPPSPTEKPLGIKAKAQETSPLPKTTSESKSLTLKARRYFLQVGAFSRREATSSLLQELRKLGYQPIILDPLPSDRTPLYRVRIGPFSSLPEAEAVLSRLRSAGPATSRAFIVRD